jgi:uncharacterized protein (DUF433 family)
MVMEWSDYIHADPAILTGKPVVRGSRLGVQFLLELFAAGWTHAQVLESFPHLTPEALRAVFAFAAEAMQDQSFSAMSTAAVEATGQKIPARMNRP